MATSGSLSTPVSLQVPCHNDIELVPSGAETSTSEVQISTTSSPRDTARIRSASSGSTVYIGRGVDPSSKSAATLAYPSQAPSQMTANDLKRAMKTTSRHSRYNLSGGPSGMSQPASRLSGRTGCESVVSLRPLDSVQSKIGSIDNWYELETPPIKEGSFGKIYRGESKEGGGIVAVKTIAFDSIREAQDQASFEFEIHVSRQLKHPNIVRLVETIKDEAGRSWNLVMELCEGGDLFDLIKANCGPGRIKEPVLARLIYQMLDGIKYCHHHCFCHRDIKPENYMLYSEGWGSPLKLIDFGLATAFEPGTMMTLRCGTLHYSAPEALRCKYTEKCDIWGIGVVFYMLCIGQWPFFDKNENTLASVIASGPDVFGEQNATQTAAFDRASGNKVAIKALLKELLCPDAQKRPTAKALLDQNNWIAKARLYPLESGRCCDVQ